MKSTAIIEWQKATYSVPEGFWMKKKEIVSGLDLVIHPGSSVAFMGPNGAGKTTTLKLGAGLLKPVKGQVLIKGRAAHEPQAREKMGFVTENQYIYPQLTLKEWLTMLGRLSGLSSSALRNRIGQLAEKFGLEQKLIQPMNTLSKGQRQRAGLAQALLHDPDLLLLDEPMSGLDPSWRHKVQALLETFNKKGGTLVFSSHNLSDAVKMADRVHILSRGEVRWSGTPKALRGQTFQIIFKPKDVEYMKALFPGKIYKELPDTYFEAILTEKEKKILFQSAAATDAVEIDSVIPEYSDYDQWFS